VPLPPGEPVTGVVGSDLVKSLDWRARKAVLIGAVKKEVVAKVLARLKTLLAEGS
jgi:mRNA interferase MazF